jgi:hypothetical protein
MFKIVGNEVQTTQALTATGGHPYIIVVTATGTSTNPNYNNPSNTVDITINLTVN